MSFFSWLRNSKRSEGAHGRRQPSGSRRWSTFEPRIEALEDRLVLSTLTVTTNAEYSNGLELGLGDAVLAAKSGDTIVFDPSLSGQTISLTQELVVNKSLTIQGLGANNLTINASYGPTGPTRLLEVDPGGNLTLTGLTLTGGGGVADTSFGYVTPYDYRFEGDGGAILNLDTLALSNCIVSGNQAVNLGGGIYNDGTLTLSGTTVSNNAAGEGGGIFNDSVNPFDGLYGNVTITSGSTVTGNTAFYDGGGIYNNGNLTIADSSVTGNYASHEGGGIYNNGDLTVDYSTVTGNRPDDVYNLGKFQHNHSTIGKVVRH